jgi:hypothetical protein
MKRKGPDAIQESNRMGDGCQVRNAGAGSRRLQEREHYARLRDAWITLAKRCEPFNISDVTDSEK